jgi:alcohol dehydrogenase class IV
MTWDAVHLFECPTRVFYGRGASGGVGERLGELGVTRALLVSDRGVEAAGTVAAVADAIQATGIDVAVYADTQPNPTTTNVAEASALYRERSCDGIVGLGGGSSMDCAKGAGIEIACGGPVAEYRGIGNVPSDLPPLCCIPTTCGTGSEVTFNAVITDPNEHFKLVYVTRRLAPDVALVDPALVETAPSSVIAATAADALAHAVESYVNTGSDPLLDSINIAAIRMIGRNLRAAVSNTDPEAIEQLALASTMAGIAFNMNANAIVHAASTPVTARHGVPHGVANGIFMPYGLAFLAPACQRQLGEIADALGEDVADLSDEEAAQRGIEAVRALVQEVGIPATLKDYGLDPADLDIPQLVEDAMKSRNIVTNPRPVTRADLEELYRAVSG